MREHKWMSLDDVLRAIPAIAAEEISQVARGVQHSDQTKEGFLEAYMAAEGSPKKMRKRDTGYKSHPWSQRRRQFLSRHLAQISQGTEKLWDEKGEPTRRHLALVAWAYTPLPSPLLMMGSGSKESETYHPSSQENMRKRIPKICPSSALMPLQSFPKICPTVTGIGQNISTGATTQTCQRGVWWDRMSFSKPLIHASRSLSACWWRKALLPPRLVKPITMISKTFHRNM